MIFEGHAHYDDPAFDPDRGELFHQLKEEGIGYVINIGASIKTTQNTIDLAEKHPFIYGAAGVHPSETAELNEESFQWLREQCDHPKVVAVGEIGLDYYWDTPERSVQKKWFERQIRLGIEKKLPLVIHSRDAARDTIEIMKTSEAGLAGGVIHCYSYTKETAGAFLDMGFYFGIGGVVTFQNAKKLKEAVEYIPIERILLETDSPYLAPTPYRGKRNSSLYLPLIAKQIAELKGITYDEVTEITSENARRLFGIG